MLRMPEITQEEMPTFQARLWNILASIKHLRDVGANKTIDGSRYNSITRYNGEEFGYYSTPQWFVFVLGGNEFHVMRDLHMPKTFRMSDCIENLYGECVEFVQDYFNEEWE